MPLTDAKIRNAKPRKKIFKLYDTGGLHLEVSPAGGRWWRLKYRFGGKSKRISLGVYPDVSLKDARERRDAERRILASGVDPSAARKQEKLTQAERDAHTFQKVAEEWLTKFSPAWVPAHAARKRRLFERDIFPAIANRPIAEITAPELVSVLRRIEQRGVLVTERRALVGMRQVLSYAFAAGLVKHNIAADIKGALPPVPENHFAAVVKPEELAGILRKLEGYDGTLPVRCALKLMPMLFVRPGELRRMEWSEVDLDAGLWEIPAAKMKMRESLVVPLSNQAVVILRELHALTGKNKYAFPSARGKGRPMSDAAVLAAMRRMDIPADVQSGHGFRASARTVLVEVLGVRPDYVEHQLAHRVKDPNGTAYNRTSFLNERKRMMQDWSDYLHSLKIAKVLSFPAATSA